VTSVMWRSFRSGFLEPAPDRVSFLRSHPLLAGVGADRAQDSWKRVKQGRVCYGEGCGRVQSIVGFTPT